VPKKRSNGFEKMQVGLVCEAWKSFSLAPKLLRYSSKIKNALLLKIYKDIIIYYLTTKDR